MESAYNARRNPNFARGARVFLFMFYGTTDNFAVDLFTYLPPTHTHGCRAIPHSQTVPLGSRLPTYNCYCRVRSSGVINWRWTETPYSECGSFSRSHSLVNMCSCSAVPSHAANLVSSELQQQQPSCNASHASHTAAQTAERAARWINQLNKPRAPSFGCTQTDSTIASRSFAIVLFCLWDVGWGCWNQLSIM